MFLMPFLRSFTFCLLFLVLMCLLFQYIILYLVIIPQIHICFLARDRTGVDLDGRGDRKEQRSSRRKRNFNQDILYEKIFRKREKKKHQTRSNLCYILVKNMAAFSCTLIIRGRLQWNESLVEEISRLHGTQTVEWLLFTVLQKTKSRREQKVRKRMWFVKRVSAGLLQWRIYDKKTTVIAILELLRRNFPLCTRAM